MSRPARRLILPLLVLLAACTTPGLEEESAPSAHSDGAPPPPAGSVAFTLEERDLLPENLAYDPVEAVFYVGSARQGKVVRVRADGSMSDFIAPRQDGLWMVLGMKVDAERRHLWVASSDGDALEGRAPGKGNAAGLFQFDLATGRLLGKWPLDEPGGTHFFNDLVVTPSGDVYATHMFRQTAVYVIQAADPRLQIFARPGDFRAANGIALAPDGTLYVASRQGLSRFDPATAARTRLTLPAGAAFSPIDGLYHHRGTLIGIHPEENMVRRFVLDAAGEAVTAIEVLEADHPALDSPTTGVVVDDALYFLANPQLGKTTGGELPPWNELEETIVLRLPLSG